MKKMLQKGFTLIELLVVITIIGILATGAVTIFTTQIEKARDTTRIGDIKALQSAVEQYFQDKYSYPVAATITGSTDGIGSYMQQIPQDPSSGKLVCMPATGTTMISCDYKYEADSDTANAITGYEVSTAFENKNNVTSKAIDTADGGNEADRFEQGTLKSKADVDITSGGGTIVKR